MKVKSRIVLENAIEQGISYGYSRAFKHNENPNEQYIKECIEDAIWLELDKMLSFDDDYAY